MRKKTATLLRKFAKEAFQAEKESRPGEKTVAPSWEATYRTLKFRWTRLSPNEKRVLASDMRSFLEVRSVPRVADVTAPPADAMS